MLIYTLGECQTVECVQGNWSSWSAECGNMTRSRPIDVVQKNILRLSCEGVKQKV